LQCAMYLLVPILLSHWFPPFICQGTWGNLWNKVPTLCHAATICEDTYSSICEDTYSAYASSYYLYKYLWRLYSKKVYFGAGQSNGHVHCFYVFVLMLVLKQVLTRETHW
jgi:hypothetical protein